MHELKELYFQLIRDQEYMRTLRNDWMSEWKKQALQTGHAEMVLEFFLEIEGYDLSREELLQVYKILADHFMVKGVWLSVEEARLTATWRNVKRLAERAK